MISQEADHFYGDEDECRIAERMAKYRVNGVAGAGIVEWQFRNNVDLPNSGSLTTH